ncbi:hypothetical protein CPB85DRAFT_1255595 [Mucidula mucida]|nr:hypothetical protein CPB85DRAFT_1255595 [Mucidula mucida]
MVKNFCMMPKTKSGRRTKNLGLYAQKRLQKGKRQSSPPEEVDNIEEVDNTELSTNVDDVDEDLIVLPEDDAPLMPEADLLQWLNVEESAVHTSKGPRRRGKYHSTQIRKELSVRCKQEVEAKKKRKDAQEALENARLKLKPTVLQDFWRKRKTDTQEETQEETDVIDLADTDSDSETDNLPHPSTSRAQVDIPPISLDTSRPSSRDSSTFPSRANSVASSVPASDASFNSHDSMDIDEDTPEEDPLMAGLDHEGVEIEDAPINFMTPKELVEEGLEAFGVDLIDELGLDQLEMDDEREEELREPESSQPGSEPPPRVDVAKQPNPKEWYIYADEAFNL